MKIGNLDVLNSKETKPIIKAIFEQWGYKYDMPHAFLKKGNDIYLVTKDIDKINHEQLRINSLGLYIGEYRHEQIRLSIEGSQLIGRKATKNIVEVTDEEVGQWIRGGNLNTDIKESNFVIIQNKKDFYGCGRIKDGVILNSLPKARRLNN